MARETEDRKYRLSPPDGGWGYVIMLSTTVIMIATIVPLGVLGIFFGKFLGENGDDTSGITLISSVYNTISFFMGIVANVLLKKYSCRKVGLIGSVIYFIGTLGTIFATSLGGLIFTFGVLEGIGFGLLLPASFSALNAYFDKKMAFMMSVSQTLMVIGYIVIPYVANWSMDMYGYRGTLLLLAGLSAFCFPSSVALQPVKWHLKKEKIEDENRYSLITIQHVHEADDSVEKPFLHNNNTTATNAYSKDKLHRRSKSLVYLGQEVPSVACLRDQLKMEGKKVTFWKSLVQSLDLHLFTDFKYMNMAIGLSLSFTADVAFFPIISSIMARLGFTSSEVALMISVFFGADLVARIILSVISAFFPINSKMLILISSALTAGLRIALILNDTLNYKLVVLAAMGFLRCFIQTPQALVISDDYPNNFESAYSVYMVVNGVLCMIIGPLMSYVKAATNSDIWVCHLLTAAFLITVVSWTIEMVVCKKKAKNDSGSKT